MCVCVCWGGGGEGVDVKEQVDQLAWTYDSKGATPPGTGNEGEFF